MPIPPPPSSEELCQGHEFKDGEGKAYTIACRAKDFDTFLRVEDANGKELGVPR